MSTTKTGLTSIQPLDNQDLEERGSPRACRLVQRQTPAFSHSETSPVTAESDGEVDFHTTPASQNSSVSSDVSTVTSIVSQPPNGRMIQRAVSGGFVYAADRVMETMRGRLPVEKRESQLKSGSSNWNVTWEQVCHIQIL